MDITKSTFTMRSSTVDDFIGSAIAGDTANIELNDVTIQNGSSVQSTSSVYCLK